MHFINAPDDGNTAAENRPLSFQSALVLASGSLHGIICDHRQSVHSEKQEKIILYKNSNMLSTIFCGSGNPSWVSKKSFLGHRWPMHHRLAILISYTNCTPFFDKIFLEIQVLRIFFCHGQQSLLWWQINSFTRFVTATFLSKVLAFKPRYRIWYSVSGTGIDNSFTNKMISVSNQLWNCLEHFPPKPSKA